MIPPTSRDELKLYMQTARHRFQGQNVCCGLHALFAEILGKRLLSLSSVWLNEKSRPLGRRLLSSSRQSPKAEAHWLGSSHDAIPKPVAVAGRMKHSDWLGPGSCSCLSSREWGSSPTQTTDTCWVKGTPKERLDANKKGK